MSVENQKDRFNPAKKVGTLFDEFKAFAFKGNVIDLAVGVIIGAAFGAIVNSLVKDIVMPLISLITPGSAGYQDWTWTIGGTVGPDGTVTGGKTISYGKFLAEVLNFLIVAFALFIFIKKFLGWVMRSRTEVAATPALTKDQELLTEIRDTLKQRAS